MDRPHRRRSPRLRDYDYAQPGAYFVTSCAKDREWVFGHVMDGSVQLNQAGRIVQAEWLGMAFVRREIDLDEFIVLPNPVHGIVVIRDDAVGAPGRAPLQAHSMPRSGPALRSLGTFVAGFKAGSTKRINQHRAGPGVTVWQRNCDEPFVRDEEGLRRIQEYIADNPLVWRTDEENPDCVRR